MDEYCKHPDMKTIQQELGGIVYTSKECWQCGAWIYIGPLGPETQKRVIEGVKRDKKISKLNEGING